MDPSLATPAVTKAESLGFCGLIQKTIPFSCLMYRNTEGPIQTRIPIEPKCIMKPFSTMCLNFMNINASTINILSTIDLSILKLCRALTYNVINNIYN